MKLKSRILYIFLLLAGFFGFAVWCVFSAITIFSAVPWYVFVPLFISGLAFTVYAGIVLHEAGHLVFGLFAGMKFKELRIPFFIIRSSNGRIKVFFNVKNSFLGSCEMYPSGSGIPYPKAFAWEAFGGLAGSFTALSVSVLFLILTPFISAYPVILFGFAAPFLYVILLENAFPAEVNGARTDGGQLLEILRKTPSSQVLVSVLTAQACYRAGKAPSELPYELLFNVPQIPENDSNYALLLNNRYLYALDCGDISALKDAHLRIRDVLPNLPEVYAEQLICDIFFDSLFTFPDDEFVKVNKNAVFKTLDADDDVNSCRIRGYYYLRAGDTAKAFAEIEKGRSLARIYPMPGIAKMELRLISELESKIALIALRP
ncbi:MAG: hypothetical protein J6Z34_06475 [Clostridia bacterium]|nr:hypothetical protein [Clostridia bacterium]